MQITSNTTGMSSELSVSVDKVGRERCIAVTKSTFTIDRQGRVHPDEEQEPLHPTDMHWGPPESSSVRYEYDFAPYKPKTDILINGYAFSPTGKPVERLMVSLQLNNLRKDVLVLGDRLWEHGLVGLRPSAITPFVKMPLVYERAFGGTDHLHPDPKHHGAEFRNPVGVGFRRNPQPRQLEGTPLPNLEDARTPISHWKDTPQPIGLGPVGRGWQPRLAHAGTYDERWLREHYPFLPADFNERYFLCAPEDQQVPHLVGGEVIRCTNMTPEGELTFSVPKRHVPVLFRFRDKAQEVNSVLDTLVIEPDRRRLLLTWRASVLLGWKMTALREVLIGQQPVRLPPGRGHGKPHFNSLAELVAWSRQRAKGRRGA